MQAQFLNLPFLIASQEYCTYFLFPPFLVSSAVISSYFLRQSLLFSSPFCGRFMCVSACCCTAAVVHPHDPMTKGRGGCRECHSPVHCGTPLPDVTLFEGRVGVESVSCTGTCVPSVQTGGHFLFPRPTPYLVVSYHQEHDIDRFLATPFLIVLLLLSAISYGSFLIFSKFEGLISYKGVSYEWAGTVFHIYVYQTTRRLGGSHSRTFMVPCSWLEVTIFSSHGVDAEKVYMHSHFF